MGTKDQGEGPSVRVVSLSGTDSPESALESIIKKLRTPYLEELKMTKAGVLPPKVHELTKLNTMVISVPG